MTRQINLFNPALRLKRAWLTGRSLLVGVGVFIVLLGLYGGVVRWENQRLQQEADRVNGGLSQMQDELTRLNQEHALRKVNPETEAALARAEAALLGRERVRDALESGALGSPEGFSEFLRAFARQAQESLWMVGLQMAEGGRNITLDGRTLNPDRIPGYILGLNGESILRGRSFEALNVQLMADDKQAPALRPTQAARTAETAEQNAGDATAKIPPYYEFQLAATMTKSGFESTGGALPTTDARR